MPKPVTQEEWNQWYSKVYGYFYRRVNTAYEAEELTAATLNDFYLKKEVRSDYGLMWAIAKNKFRDFLKAKSRQPSMADIEDIPENLLVSKSTYSPHYSIKMEKLHNCIQNQLQFQDLKIVELSIVCDFDSRRIGEEMDMSADNVRQRLSRALKKVREHCRELWATV